MEGVDEAAKGAGFRSGFLRLAAWGCLWAPAGIVLHELGHLVAGLALGFPVRMNVGSVSGGPQLGASPDMAVALQAASGPVVTIILMLVAAGGLRNRPAPDWAFALAITAPIRFIVGGTYLFWVAKAWLANMAFEGTPNFDEYNAALALGLSPPWVVMIQMLLLTAYWLWAATRPAAHNVLARLAAVLIGAVAGIALWMAAVGPALLGLF